VGAKRGLDTPPNEFGTEIADEVTGEARTKKSTNEVCFRRLGLHGHQLRVSLLTEALSLNPPMDEFNECLDHTCRAVVDASGATLVRLERRGRRSGR